MKFRNLFMLLVTVIAGSLSVSYPQNSSVSVKGNWTGTLSIGANQLRLVLKIVEQSDGQLKAGLDSLDQNARDLTVDVISFQNNTLHFEMKALQIVFDGTLNKDGTEIAGTFSQAGGSFPLLLRKEGVALSVTPVRRGQVQLVPCNSPSLTSDALCGTYDVYEDRVQRGGRKIALNIILLPATGKPAPDLLFYLAGGPGAAATGYSTEAFMTRLRRNRDVVLVDQRGTGKSNLLACSPLGSRNDMRGYFGEVMIGVPGCNC